MRRVLSLPGLRVGELRTLGAAAARGEILAFVDADHVIADDWVRTAVDCLSDSRTGAAGALCHPPDAGTWVQSAYDELRCRLAGRQHVEWLGSGNLAVRRDIFQRLGGFDSRLETCEDVDLCQRIRAAGLHIVSDDRMRSTHFGDPATLGALFRGELWRGRDNLRVSLAAPLTLRALPSVAMPVAGALALVVGICGLLLSPTGLWLTSSAIASLIVMSLMHTALIRRRMAGPGASSLFQVFAVTTVFDVARALALLTRMPHRRAARRP